MTRRFWAPLLTVALAFSACSDHSASQPKPQKEKQAPAVDAAVQQPASQQPSSSDCVRGEPEALLASRSEFSNSSSNEAIETVQTDSPLHLTIRHFGCTHYALDFEFTWPGPRMPDPKVALDDAAQLLEKLPFNEANQLLMKSLVSALRKIAQDPYKQPLTMSETETLTATIPALNILRVRYDVAL